MLEVRREAQTIGGTKRGGTTFLVATEADVTSKTSFLHIR